MKRAEVCNNLGCLLIDEPKPGEDALSGLCSCLRGAGVNAAVFAGGARLADALREAYCAAKAGCERGAVVGRGGGGWAALALSEQLPVDRLVLVDLQPANRIARACRRVAAFARRNLAFCVSDVLIVATRPGDWPERLAEGLPNSRVTRLDACGDLRKNSDPAVKSAILSFLIDGELPKSLAENPEMCIIYG